jgi:hypothetical protein
VKGQPNLFIHGHGSRRQTKTFDERYSVAGLDDCWEWTGRVGQDGKRRFGRGSELAHRFAYRRAHGLEEIEGDVTQTCGNFLCVNPQHLALREDVLPPEPNPSGLCMCGCGQPAPLARQTDRKYGYVRGKPLRYVRGHVGYLRLRQSLGSDLWTVSDHGYATACWIWKGVLLPAGYGRVKIHGRTRLAHRAMYEQEVGPIPDGFHVHHRCRQKACVRPDHLEALDRSDHARRGHSRHR